MKVETLQDKSVDALDRQINNYIKRGYKLSGDLIIHDLPVGTTNKKETMYFQRMILEDIK